MKRIISLGLAAMILLGAIASAVMMVAMAAVQVDAGILTSEGILIESWSRGTNSLTLVLVDTNISWDSDYEEEFKSEFFASLLTASFYPKDLSEDAIQTSVTVLSAGKERNLRFRVTIPNVAYDKKGNTLKFRMYYEWNGEACQYLIETTLDGLPPEVKPSEPDPDPDPEEPVPDAATPYIIMQGASYGSGSVPAGSDFSLSLSFFNTSKDIKLENIIMKVAPTSGLSISGGSNTFYISSLDKGGAMSKALPMKAGIGATEAGESVSVTFSYEYIDNKVRKTGTSTETVTIPVVQTERFDVELTETPTMLWPGDRANAGFSYMNKGRTTIYNLSASIQGEIDEPNQVVNLGNIAPGASGTGKFNLSSSMSGMTLPISITFTYENEQGVVSTLVKEFSVEVYEDTWVDPGVDPGVDPWDPGIDPGETEQGMPWWQKALFGVGCVSVGGASGTWSFLKTKLKREELYDEDI